MTIRVRHHFGIGFELNRMLGTATRRRDVAGNVTPTGELRQGPTSLTFASATGFYYVFSNRRVQPYVGAGLAAVWERGVSPDYDSLPPVEQGLRV